jgi:hypothetical protein
MEQDDKKRLDILEEGRKPIYLHFAMTSLKGIDKMRVLIRDV